ncbi:MAG: YlbF family regulator [Anaerovoracaceae bacterium]
MNVYDQAHGLATAIKESEEYKQYEEIKVRAKQNSELDKTLKDFQAKQFQLQAKQMMGEQVDEDAMQQVQALYGVMMQDPLAAEYLQCEMRFSMMMKDVYEILGKVINLGQGMGQNE